MPNTVPGTVLVALNVFQVMMAQQPSPHISIPAIKGTQVFQVHSCALIESKKDKNQVNHVEVLGKQGSCIESWIAPIELTCLSSHLRGIHPASPFHSLTVCLESTTQWVEPNRKVGNDCTKRFQRNWHSRRWWISDPRKHVRGKAESQCSSRT